MTLCRIGDLITNENGVKIGQSVDDLRVSATKLAFLLTSYGHSVGETTIRKHRRGECLCHLKKH